MNRNFNDPMRDKYRMRDRIRRDRNVTPTQWEYEHMGPRNYAMREKRDKIPLRKREFVPQHPQMYQPAKSEGQKDVGLRSLSDAKGRLKELVLLSGQRKALTQLYTGLPHENWLLAELVDTFPILITRRAGVNFIYAINHKVRELFMPWHSALLQNVINLLEFPVGALIFCDIIPLVDVDTMKELAKYCWTIYQTKYDEQYMSLYTSLIHVFKDDSEIINPLLDTDWSELKNQQEMAITLISEIPSYADRLYSKYSGTIVGMTQAVDFVHTICAFLEYGSTGVRDQIFVSMTSSIYDLAMRDPSWNVLLMMIIVGTNDQRRKIGETLMQIIESNSTLPRHFDILLTKFLFSLHVPDRISYISNLTPYIDKLLKPKFVEMIKYMNCLLSE